VLDYASTAENAKLSRGCQARATVRLLKTL